MNGCVYTNLVTFDTVPREIIVEELFLTVLTVIIFLRPSRIKFNIFYPRPTLMIVSLLLMSETYRIKYICNVFPGTHLRLRNS